MLLRGGHPACERRVAFFLPYYMDEEDFQEEEQFRALQVTAGFGQPGHRDYLGAILNLGIRRDFLGDIWVKENRARRLLPAQCGEPPSALPRSRRPLRRSGGRGRPL